MISHQSFDRIRLHSRKSKRLIGEFSRLLLADDYRQQGRVIQLHNEIGHFDEDLWLENRSFCFLNREF